MARIIMNPHLVINTLTEKYWKKPLCYDTVNTLQVNYSNNNNSTKLLNIKQVLICKHGRPQVNVLMHDHLWTTHLSNIICINKLRMELVYVCLHWRSCSYLKRKERKNPPFHTIALPPTVYIGRCLIRHPNWNTLYAVTHGTWITIVIKRVSR